MNTFRPKPECQAPETPRGSVPAPFFAGDPFLEFLRARRGRIFYLKPYIGNSGDSLIMRGATELLLDLGITLTVDPRLADVVLWPGGNPTMWESNLSGWRETWANYPDAEFVVAPATFQFGTVDWAEEVRLATAKVTGLFARDVTSYENLKLSKLPDRITLGLSHDPALYLRNSLWLDEHKRAVTEDYALAAFRSDHEARLTCTQLLGFVVGCLPTRLANRLNRSLLQRSRRRKIAAAKGKVPCGTRFVEWDVSETSFDVFMEVVRSSSIVHTDRLHVMLLAAMLGKPVVAYETSYGKLEAVYEHSLRQWANVSFVKVKER
jgi:exopolysaccharide biosynthesis predicted pyruvyltransferase EpsI